MKKIEVTITVSIAWWLDWYLAGVSLMEILTFCEADESKVRRVVRRAIRVNLVPE